MRRETRARPRDDLRDLGEHAGVDPGLGGRELEGELGVQARQDRLERLEGGRLVRVACLQVLGPVPPPADELAVVTPGLDEVPRHGEIDRGLAAGYRREPVVGVRGRVGQPRVEHDHLGAVRPRLRDPLRVRIEVVAGFQVGADQVDDLGVGVIGARPVRPHPELVAGPPAAGADVRVRVVAVDAPAGEHPLGEAVLARPADVHHDLVLPVLDDRGPDPARERVERLVPADPLPAARAAGAGPAQRVQDPVRVGHLVDGGRAFRAVAAPGARMLGVSLELAHPQAVPVHVGEQAAGRLAVEAGGGDQHVAVFLAGRPGS